MMNKMVILYIFASVALTLAMATDKPVGVLLDESQADGKGNYRFTYATDDGAKRKEVGQIRNSYLRVQGAYEFVGEDGEVYSVSYVADERGFRPVLDQ